MSTVDGLVWFLRSVLVDAASRFADEQTEVVEGGTVVPQTSVVTDRKSVV